MLISFSWIIVWYLAIFFSWYYFIVPTYIFRSGKVHIYYYRFVIIVCCLYLFILVFFFSISILVLMVSMYTWVIIKWSIIDNSSPYSFAYFHLFSFALIIFRFYFSITLLNCLPPFHTVSWLPGIWFRTFKLKTRTISTCWYILLPFQSVQLLLCIMVLFHHLVSCSLEIHRWLQSWLSVFGCLTGSIVSDLLHHITLLLMIRF